MTSEHNPANQSFLSKLCPCCFFPEISTSNPTKSASNSCKNPSNSMKDPLLPSNENPIFGLKPKLKQKTRSPSKQKQINNNLFKKNLCNCEFLKELNKNNENFYIDNTSHYDKFLNSKKMNPDKKKRLSDNFKVLNTLNKYPKNKVFLLKYNNSGILCKITYKNFKFPFVKKKSKPGTKSMMSKRNSNQNTPESHIDLRKQSDESAKLVEEVDEKLNIFSKFHQGIKIDTDSFEKILPEKVANYIAKKFRKNSLIIDAISGVGATAIQLALEGHMVLANEMNDKRMKFILNNAEIYGVNDKIDVIRGNSDNFRCRKKIDAVVITMDYENLKTSTESFCLFANLVPDIRKTLENAFRITENVVLIVPKFVDVSELALLFTDVRRQGKHLFRSFSIELECLAFNNKIEKYAIYFGDQKSLSLQEEFDFLINYFNGDNHQDFKSSETGVFIRHIIEKIGVFDSCQNLMEIESFSTELPHKNDTLFQLFLERLIKDNLISKEEISEYLTTQKLKDFFKKSYNNPDSKEGTYTFNPFRFQSLDKSMSKSYKNELTYPMPYESPFNSIDLRDDNLTKKQIARISIGENTNFFEKDDYFYSLDHEYIMKKRDKSLNTSNNDGQTSMYSELNGDISSDNKSHGFEETEVVDLRNNLEKGFGKKTAIY